MKTVRSFSLTYKCDWQMPGEATSAPRAEKAQGVAASMGLLWLPGYPTNDNGQTFYRGRGYVRLASARS